MTIVSSVRLHAIVVILRRYIWGLNPDCINVQNYNKMSYFFDKTPVLEAGLARSVMRFILTQVKSHRGLTTFMEHRGINGRWLKPDDSYNIRVAKLLKIMEIKAHYQTDEEFLDDWQKTGEYLLRLVRHPDHISYL